MQHTIPYILIADDDLEDIFFLKEAIAKVKKDINIQTASNGQELLQFLKECDPQYLPSVILLDYKMPYLNGAEVLLEMSAEPAWTSIPKIVWSSTKEPNDAKICLERGAVDYLNKPVSQAELRAIADRLLRCIL